MISVEPHGDLVVVYCFFFFYCTEDKIKAGKRRISLHLYCL